MPPQKQGDNKAYGVVQGLLSVLNVLSSSDSFYMDLFSKH